MQIINTFAAFDGLLLVMTKEMYETPSAKVFEAKAAGCICDSGVRSSRRGYGTADTSDNTEQIWD